MCGSDRKTAVRYLWAAAGCAVLSAVYETFSHGVFSLWMIGLCLWPLLLGALPFWLWGRGWREGRRFWHAGVITLAAGSAVMGVLEIYGTDSALTVVYFAAGVLLLLTGGGLGICKRRSGMV